MAAALLAAIGLPVMTIKYEPSKLIKKQRIREKAAKLVKGDLTINRTALKSLTDFGLLPPKALERVALKVIKQQRERAAEERAAGATKAEANEEARNGDKLMQARVQSAALYEQTRIIQKAYRGEFYRWLKSTAENPRDEHIPNYGKVFQLGVGDDNGDDPGDLYGCQCGMELLVDDTPEQFNERLEGEL